MHPARPTGRFSARASGASSASRLWTEFVASRSLRDPRSLIPPRFRHVEQAYHRFCFSSLAHPSLPASLVGGQHLAGWVSEQRHRGGTATGPISTPFGRTLGKDTRILSEGSPPIRERTLLRGFRLRTIRDTCCSVFLCNADVR